MRGVSALGGTDGAAGLGAVAPSTVGRGVSRVTDWRAGCLSSVSHSCREEENTNSLKPSVGLTLQVELEVAVLL